MVVRGAITGNNATGIPGARVNGTDCSVNVLTRVRLLLCRVVAVSALETFVRSGIDVFVNAVQTVRIDIDEGVVEPIVVQIEALRIRWIGEEKARRIGGHKSSHRRSVVPSPEVVVTGFGIPFFASEVISKLRVLSCVNG